MKLEIYQEKQKETTVRLALRQGSNGIILHAVDENGNHVDFGCLIKFCNDGTIKRVCGVSTSLGFQLNDEGQIKEHGIDD